ncbi:tail assembly chaperone [Streptomyces phage Wentworth]|nr:tail assembly chaperone [Streptomyces phage Wentworth]
MALVTKAQINAAVDRKWEDVPVPEWGGDVRLMALSAADRGYIEAGSVVANGQTPQLKVESLKVYREKLVGMAMVDENFERLYSNKEIAAGDLGKKDGAVIERLAAKVQEMSGMGRYAQKAAEGNSDAAPNDSSASA